MVGLFQEARSALDLVEGIPLQVQEGEVTPEAKYKQLVQQMRLVLREPGHIDRIRLYSLQSDINVLRKQHPELSGLTSANVEEVNNNRIQG